MFVFGMMMVFRVWFSSFMTEYFFSSEPKPLYTIIDIL